MKAKDLIDKLKEADPESEVYVNWSDCCGHDCEDTVGWTRTTPAWEHGRKKYKARFDIYP